LLGNTIRPTSFKWLFAELLVIVLGILIAIQIEEWRQYRKDRVEEREILLSVNRDIKGFLFEYGGVVGQHEAAINGVTTVIVGIAKGGMSEFEILEASREATRGYLMSSASTSFEGHLSSGAIGLIQDRDLEGDLRILFGFHRPYIEDLSREMHQSIFEIMPLLVADTRLVPDEDYEESMSYRAELIIPAESYPASDLLLTELIRLNRQRKFFLEKLSEHIELCKTLSSRIEDLLAET
jgi:hypothetical protein